MKKARAYGHVDFWVVQWHSYCLAGLLVFSERSHPFYPNARYPICEWTSNAEQSLLADPTTLLYQSITYHQDTFAWLVLFAHPVSSASYHTPSWVKEKHLIGCSLNIANLKYLVSSLTHFVVRLKS